MNMTNCSHLHHNFVIIIIMTSVGLVKDRRCSGQIVTICGSSVAPSAPIIVIIMMIVILLMMTITCMRSMVGRAGEGEEEQAVVKVPRLVSECVSRHARLFMMMMMLMLIKTVNNSVCFFGLFTLSPV